MATNHLIAIGLDGAAFAELERLLRRAAPGVAADTADSAAGLSELALADPGTVLLLRLGDGDAGRRELERLRERGVATPALLLVPAAALSRGLEIEGLGAVDVLPEEGYTAFDLQRALRALSAARREEQRSVELEQRAREAERERDVLARRVEELELRASALQIDDELTGLRNDRYLLQRVDEAVRLARRYGVAVTGAVVGLDNLQAIRAVHGPIVADFVLLQVAQRLRAAVRESDLLARYGLDGFFLLSLLAAPAEVEDLARRLRLLVGGQPIEAEGDRVPLELSVGVAAFRPEMSGASELIQTAVEALAQARERRGGVEAL